MAWREPYTGWGAGDLVTADDMNRIGGNLNYLLDRKEFSTWSDTDFVYQSDWARIRNAMDEIQILMDKQAELPDDSVTSYNFNLVESFILSAKEPIDLIRKQKLANKYSGQWYADSEIYAGGF